MGGITSETHVFNLFIVTVDNESAKNRIADNHRSPVRPRRTHASWTPLGRSQSTATVMQAVLSTVGQKASNPVTLHQMAHTVAGNITLDSGTGLSDLATLGRSTLRARRPGATTIVDLPTEPRDESIIVSPSQESRELLARYGYSPKTCRPAGS